MNGIVGPSWAAFADTDHGSFPKHLLRILDEGIAVHADIGEQHQHAVVLMLGKNIVNRGGPSSA